jgi:dihydroorotase
MESNWFIQIAEDHVPAMASSLSGRQRSFLAGLRDVLAPMSWELGAGERLDVDTAIELQEAFYKAVNQTGLPLREALLAVYAGFVDEPFTQQIGLFLMRLERPFALQRLKEISDPKPLAA